MAHPLSINRNRLVHLVRNTRPAARTLLPMQQRKVSMTLCPSESLTGPELFEKWCIEMEKEYKSEEEKEYRFGIWKKNYERSKSKGRPNPCPNCFGDLTNAEWRNRFKGSDAWRRARRLASNSCEKHGISKYHESGLIQLNSHLAGESTEENYLRAEADMGAKPGESTEESTEEYLKTKAFIAELGMPQLHDDEWM